MYAVHPGAEPGEQIGGHDAYPDLAAIGQRMDLAVISVPAQHVLEAVEGAARAGAHSAVVLTSGLGELDEAGKEIERQMLTVAREHSMRLVGPNCLGVVDNAGSVRLNATFTNTLPPVGGLAIGSQSGGVGITILDAATTSGLGVASFVSLGNKADVSGNDLLSAWIDDDNVTAAALYLESFGNAQKFARVAHRFSERKPLLALVGGRSDGGRRAGASHTAAAAAPSVGSDAMFLQAGVIGCTSLTSLIDTARLVTSQPLPAGPRVTILGNAGGLGVLAADAAAPEGLSVPELSSGLRAELSALVPGAGVGNPVDLGAAVSPEGYAAALDQILESTECDAVVAVLVGTAVTDSAALLEALLDVRRGDVRKPLLLVTHGDVAHRAGSGSEFAAFSSVEAAMGALGNAVRYVAWRAAPPGATPDDEELDPVGASRVVERAFTSAGERSAEGWLTPVTVRELLGCYGIDAPLGMVVDPAGGADAVVVAAEEIGFPVVAKVADPTVVHRTDRHLVRTGLQTGEQLLAAVAGFRAELGTDSPVLVQPQVGGGVEVGVGVIRDDAFGPLVMVAAGGVAIDVWADRVFLLPPLTDLDVARAVRSLRIWPLLSGHRGSAAVDVGALEQLLHRIGRLVLDVPEIAEMDLNPVIVTPEGLACVDAKVRLARPTRLLDAGVPRRLRGP